MRQLRPVLAIFVLSGAAGLIYEVVWSRQLVLVFGNTTQAVSTILTGFFGGMAVGAYFGGRLADRVRSPLRLYGILELALVVIVVATPVTFRLLHEIYRGAYGALQTTPELLALVRFALAIVALAPATILMGATLPTLTRYLGRGAQLSAAFGRLYSANTIGAIIGTLVAGFVLIELLGLTGALLVGASCSAIAGVVALRLSRRDEPTPPDAPAEPASPARPPSSTGAARPSLALILAFVSGLTSLGYQTLWTRLLASGTGNSTYVFSTILALFLVGIALGATTFNTFRLRIGRPVLLLAVAQVAVATMAVAGLVIVLAHPAPLDPNKALEGIRAATLGAMVVVLLPTFVMGLSFPASSALMADDPSRMATFAGRLLAANTTGAIVGTFVIPFLIIPIVGSPAAVALVALVNVGMALALVAAAREGRPAHRKATAVAAVVVGAVTVFGLVAPAGRSPFVDPSVSRIESGGGKVFASAEDEIASVQAGQRGARQLWVTGTSMTLLTVDAKLMPVLPLMLRPEAKTAATVAFGMGSAFRAALIAGLETDAIELVPTVPKMFGYFYDDAPSVLADPHGHVIVTDGRNYLELTRKSYDIIVTDPPPPIESSGAAVISSLEYYEAGRRRLNPGGVMMQWAPYGGTVDDFLAHVRSFARVFPNVIVAFGPGGYGFYMLGSEQPIAFEDAVMRSVLNRPGVLHDVSSAYDSPETTVDGWVARIHSLVWIEGDAVGRVVGSGPVITDDHPLPEYFLLHRLFGAPSPPLSPGALRALAGR
jgi:spermidine synthase